MVRLSLALVLLITAACSAGLPPPAERDDAGDDADGPAQGRLTARPTRPDEEGRGPGLHALDVFGQTAHIYVPSGYTPRRAWPLVLSLHGAGGTSENGIGPFLNAGPPPAILVAPSAVGRSWDLIEGGFGEDVAYIDRLLEWTFRRYRVDPERIGILGFSDGASYALSLGLTNGDLFRKIVALSPGYMAPVATRGKPEVFIAHGRLDRVLPFERTGQRVARLLDEAGYDVTFRPHPKGHNPRPLARNALGWFLGEGKA